MRERKTPRKIPKHPHTLTQDADGVWRNENGRRVCGVICRQTKAPCKSYPITGATRCKLHGGPMQRSNLVHAKYASTDTKLFLAEEIDKQLQSPTLRSLEPVVARAKAIFEKRLEELKRRNDRALKLDPKDFIRNQIERLSRYMVLAEKFKAGTMTEADHEWLDSERVAEELTARDADALYRGIETISRSIERMVKVEEGFKMTIDFPRMGDLVRALQGEIKQAVRAVMDEKAAEEVQKQLETRFRRMAAIPA